DSGLKVAFITGATGAIGEAIARNIAKDQNYYTVLIVRDEKKAKAVAERIRNSTGNQNIMYKILDLSSREEIFRFAKEWENPLHVLVNNAATTPRSRQVNKDGIELQFATNVLGYFWMMQAFSGQLIKSAPSRIVNVASYWAGGLNMADLEFKKRHYNNDEAYRQSKQANRMLTSAFADKFAGQKVTVVSCHPGDVNSKLSNDLGFGGHESPDQGASTPVWLSTLPHEELEPGKYYAHHRIESCRFSQNKKEVEKLYEICNSYT
ncbi:MAG: SDR family NAD(P)-dependent oxidoreductase, partial [Cyclobacteriaceae bacterium]